MSAFVCILKGEIGRVHLCGEDEEVGRKFGFTADGFDFTDRPMKGEYVRVFGVEFRIKRITHDPPNRTCVKLEPATITATHFDNFEEDCVKADFDLEPLF